MARLYHKGRGLLGGLWYTHPMLALLIAAALIGHSGEWVTRESDGTRICQLSRDLYAGEIVKAEGWCEHWTIEPPLSGQMADPDWARHMGGLFGGMRLHIEGVWR